MIHDRAAPFVKGTGASAMQAPGHGARQRAPTFEPLLPAMRAGAVAGKFAPIVPSAQVDKDAAARPDPCCPNAQTPAPPVAEDAARDDAPPAETVSDPVPPDDTQLRLARTIEQVDALQKRIDTLTAQNDAMTANHAAALAALAGEQLPAIADQIAAKLGAQLAPVLAHGAFELAKADVITRFVDEVAGELASGQAMAVRLTAPSDLVDDLRRAWPDHLPGVAIETGEAVEIAAELDTLVIETRLAKLRSALLGDGR